MHPNVYLRNFWRRTFKPEIFVAMSFADVYSKRFSEVIEPAIASIKRNGQQYAARRVDLSQTGDSILTEIADGIAHSVMVLADVSVIGYDSRSGEAFRNANVMYEVGLALACRQPGEVLLIRDDKAPFLFDVSTVPHKHVDFAKADEAKVSIKNELEVRLREVDHIRDARLSIALASLTAGERKVLAAVSKFAQQEQFFIRQRSPFSTAAIERLLDKQLIKTVAVTKADQSVFGWTEMGYALASRLDQLIPVVEATGEAAQPEDHI